MAPSFHPPAVRGVGRDRLWQERHLVAAAAGVGAVVTEVADLERTAFFLVGRALRLHFLRRPEALPADELQTEHRFHAADVQLRPKALACRSVCVRRDLAAKSALAHRARDLAAQLVVALAGDRVAAAATLDLRELTAVLLSLLRPDRAREIARLVWLGLRRAQTGTAKDLHAVPTAELSRRDALVHRAYRLHPGQAICGLRLLVALL